MAVYAQPVNISTTSSSLNPPRDPFLRAIWLIGQEADLTYQEGRAMLALWRYLGADKKQIGAALLGQLLGVSTSRAGDIFSSLQRKGYIASNGKYLKGGGNNRRATRRLTGKLKLPQMTKPSGNPDGQAAQPRRENQTGPSVKPSGFRGSEPSGFRGTDLGVRQAAPLGARSGSQGSGESGGQRLISISELLRPHADAGVAEAGGAE